MRNARTIALSAVLIALGIWGCNDVLQVQPRAAPPKNFALTSASGCGETFTMVTNEQDSLMATYGIPALQDTMSVCNTWTGSDYNTSFNITGSSEFTTGLQDSVEQVSYASGQVAGYDVNGTTVDSLSPVAPTVFDLMNADSSTRQASIDSPYYDISSSPSDAVLTPATSSAQRSGALSTAADTAKFRRHGLTRKGVRALVDALEELAPAADGTRRFHRLTRGGDETLEIDPKTELLIGQDDSDATHVLHATHHWARTQDQGWVRTETDVVSDEIVNGKTFRSESTIKYLNVRVGGVAMSPVSGGPK